MTIYANYKGFQQMLQLISPNHDKVAFLIKYSINHTCISHSVMHVDTFWNMKSSDAALFWLFCHVTSLSVKHIIKKDKIRWFYLPCTLMKSQQTTHSSWFCHICLLGSLQCNRGCMLMCDFVLKLRNVLCIVGVISVSSLYGFVA